MPLMDPQQLPDAMHSSNPSAHTSQTDAWPELKRDDGDHDHVDGPTFAQAPVVYIDGDHDAGLKADSEDLLALKSRRRRRPVGPATISGVPTIGHASTGSSTDASVAFSGFEMSYVAPPQDTTNNAPPVGGQSYGVVGGPSAGVDPQYQPRLSIPLEDVASFLQSLALSFSNDLNALRYLCEQLGRMGYDSILALAFISDHELSLAGIAFPQDQHTIRTCASQEFAIRRPANPPVLTELVTMSKWLQLCGIPRQMATLYMTNLQHFGYDNVAHFESIGHDSRALGVFHPGHYHLFKYHLERVLQQQRQQQQYAASHTQPYNMYYNTHSSQQQAEAAVFQSTLLDDLVPPNGFPMSPGLQRHYNQGANPFYPSTAESDASFTQLMHTGGSGGASVSRPPGGPPLRLMKEPELRLLYEAVNMDDKTNPCRRGKKVDWTVIATNGMGDPRFALLAQYTADELEHNYIQNHELPLHATARNSEWSAELIKLLWRVSQDTRCKNGTKTMWEQIAQGKTGVAEYVPLAKFSNSQLRSRYRTEFGDKRPQSRKKAREEKNAQAKAVAAQLATQAGADSVAVPKNAAAKQKAVAAKARKQKHDENRDGLAV